MPRLRTARKIRLCVTVQPIVRTLLEGRADEKHVSLSQALEELVIQSDGLEEYFRKQAAFHGFMAAAVSAALAHKVLGREATMDLQEQAARTARRLYGQSPTRDVTDSFG